MENVEVALVHLEVDRMNFEAVCANLHFSGRIFGVEARHFEVAGAISEVQAGSSRFGRMVLMFRAGSFQARAAVFEHAPAGFEVAPDRLEVAPVGFQVLRVIE